MHSVMPSRDRLDARTRSASRGGIRTGDAGQYLVQPFADLMRDDPNDNHTCGTQFGIRSDGVVPLGAGGVVAPRMDHHCQSNLVEP